MVKERKSGRRVFLWLILALLLHFVALMIGQFLITFVFAYQDIADGILTYDMTGKIYFNGELALQSEDYLARYVYGTSGYGTILAVPFLFLGFLIFGKIQKRPFLKNFPVQRFPVVPNVLALIIGMAVYFPTAFILSNTFLKDIVPDTGESIALIFAQTPYWILFLSTAICAPLIEELTFRGFIYTQLEEEVQHWSANLDEEYEKMREKLSEEEREALQEHGMEERIQKIKRRVPIYIIATQAIMFGAFHMNLQQFLYATLLGILFGIMRYYTKSIWPGVLAHIGFNAFSVGLYGLMQHEEWGITKLLLGMSDMTLLLITLPIFALSLYAFELVVKKQQKNG